MTPLERFPVNRPKPFPQRNPIAYRNFLRAKYEAYTGQVTVTSRPYYLAVDPCDACNLRCPTCPTGIENESRRGELPILPFRRKRSVMAPELFDCVLDELGDFLFIILFYNFGEPTSNKQLPSFVEKATARGIATEVHSNLSLPLTDEYIENLLRSGLSYLYASIDGFSQETYEKHRRGGNLALVLRNLERFAATRDRLGLSTEIVFNFLRFSFNEHEIPDAARYSESIGVGFIPREAFVNDPGWLPSHRTEDRPWEVPKEVQLGPDMGLTWMPAMPGVSKEGWPSSCGWHYGYSVVQPGGELAPCCAVPWESFDMGRIDPGKVSFGDVWNNDSYREARAHFAAGRPDTESNSASPLCTRCPWPRWVLQLYSMNDSKVIGAFHEAAKGADPAMARAFDLFCQVRFGVTTDEFCQSSHFPSDYVFAGKEDPVGTAAFVEFMRGNLGA